MKNGKKLNGGEYEGMVKTMYNCVKNNNKITRHNRQSFWFVFIFRTLPLKSKWFYAEAFLLNWLSGNVSHLLYGLIIVLILLHMVPEKRKLCVDIFMFDSYVMFYRFVCCAEQTGVLIILNCCPWSWCFRRSLSCNSNRTIPVNFQPYRNHFTWLLELCKQFFTISFV